MVFSFNISVYCHYQEGTDIDNHHDFLLENLLNFYKCLNANDYLRSKEVKETNWKQRY